MLDRLPQVADKNLLVGIATGDDAAVYRISDSQAIVATVDYFTPVVDDPYNFGAVAAANSLSDIYAMGATPLLALNIIGFPVGKLPIEAMGEILRGGGEKAKEAGIAIAGGHSIDDAEPKYGLAAIGSVHPDRIFRNSTAKPGDVLILTKPVGTGILTTALKKGKLSADSLAEITTIMAALNSAAAEAMKEVGANACTDVTGFGLLGHLTGMTKSSGVTARLSIRNIPFIDGAREFAREKLCPGGTLRNLTHYGKRVEWDPSIPEELRLLCADAQTSGGLLISITAEKASALHAALDRRGVKVHAQIGVMVEKGRSEITVAG
ncbi:MAG: selenide, water dikinase SelD [Planctomycetes bacterium RBG_16_59_8]|nr:MAG: selenide, water dikinase SelD [Planctomycetes bacterium RBG_16_59_8]